MARYTSATLVLSALAVSLVGGIVSSPPALAADGTDLASPAATVKLQAVSASSATDAWAVGFGTAPGEDTLGLTRHWDGTRWQTVPSVHPGDDSFLWGVDDLSPTDAWAVGESIGGATIQPFAEHWDGSDWQPVPFHNPIGLGKLNAVSASGPDDVWMVGTNYPSPWQTPRTFIEHWDGHTLRPVRAGRLTRARSSELTSITALAPDDVWAVGAHGRHGQTDLPLVEHFDGTSWTVVTTDLEAGLSADVIGVDALSTDDVWSVGWEGPDNQPTISALAEHWDGTSWTRTPILKPGYFSYLTGVSAVAPDDVWAVGSWAPTEQDPGGVPLIEHWDGHTWSIVSAPVRRHSAASAQSISMVDATDGFAVGQTTAAAHTTGYTIRWNGETWTR